MAFFNSIGEKKLCDKTANVLFGVYKSIKENIHMVDDKEVKKIFLTKYKDLKSSLRNSKQSLKFKLYYELYFISPNAANLVRSLRIKQR